MRLRLAAAAFAAAASLTVLPACAVAGPGEVVPAAAGDPGDSAAPSRTYAVGVRLLALRRGRDRPLPTTVWYPAVGEPGGEASADIDVAAGRFPVVLFSHGLHGVPEQYHELITRWASAGFVVAAPKYPHTNRLAGRFDRGDVRYQPADAAYVVAEVLRLDTRAGDPFAGRLATGRACAAGHSAGGYTTSGMFRAGRDARLGCGIVISGAGLESVGGDGRFDGPAARLLFVHGDGDPTVSYARGRATYDRVPWPKAFLTLRGQDHGTFLTPGRLGFVQTLATTTDFLRWTLYGDAEALRRLPADGTLPGVAVFVSTFGQVRPVG